MFSAYRRILSAPGALSFTLPGALGRLPMAMVGIGIVLGISDLYGSYELAGTVSAAYVISQAVASPQLARLVDRYGQARVMTPAVAVAAVGLCALAAAAHWRVAPPWLYPPAIVTGATIGSWGALIRARWTHVLSAPRDLHTAYSFESVLDEVLFMVGPVLATALATSLDPALALLVPAVALVVGGLFVLSRRASEPPASGRRPAGVPRRSVLRSGGMVVLIAVFLGVGAIFGAADVSAVAYAREAGMPGAAGWFLAVWALGSFVAGLVYGAIGWTSALWKRFAVGVIAMAGGTWLFLLTGSVPALVAVLLVLGLTTAPTLVNGNALVQHLVPGDRLTEGLAWMGTAINAGVSAGSAVAGWMVDRAGAAGGYRVVIAAGTLGLVLTLAALPVLRRSEPRPALPA